MGHWLLFTWVTQRDTSLLMVPSVSLYIEIRFPNCQYQSYTVNGIVAVGAINCQLF